MEWRLKEKKEKDGLIMKEGKFRIVSKVRVSLYLCAYLVKVRVSPYLCLPGTSPSVEIKEGLFIDEQPISVCLPGTFPSVEIKEGLLIDE